MVEYGIAPTFSSDDDESGFSAPPPPRPQPIYNHRGIAIFAERATSLEFNRDDSLPLTPKTEPFDEPVTDLEFNREGSLPLTTNTGPFLDEPVVGLENNGPDVTPGSDEPPKNLELQNDYELEHTLSLHEFKYGVPPIEYEPSEAESEEESLEEIEKKRSLWMKNRLLYLAFLLFLLLVLFLALTSHWVNENKKLYEEQKVIAEALEARMSTPAPTGSPTIAPTGAPSAAPTVCVDEVTVEKTCYNAGEEIFLKFHYCSPEEKNWLGLYRDGADSDAGEMIQRSLYWQLPCGGHGDSCETPLEFGNLTMTPTLGAGDYKVYGMGNMTRPYHYNAKSQTFVVRRNCEEFLANNDLN